MTAESSLSVRNTLPRDFAGIIEMTQEVYPASTPWTTAQLASHLRMFPEGQFVAVESESQRVVGMAASVIVLWDDYDVQARWRDFTDRGMFTNHDPGRGRTLYGADVMVRPSLQGRGIGKALYEARRELVERRGLLRIRAGARLRGYHRYADRMSAVDYVIKVVKGELGDPTLSFQLKGGFQVIAVVSNYVRHDPESLAYAAVIEWMNEAVARPEHYTERDQKCDALIDQLFESKGQEQVMQSNKGLDWLSEGGAARKPVRLDTQGRRMRVFTRDNGQTLRVVEGFRKQVLAAPRVSVQPKPEWTDRDYRCAAEKKVRHSARFVEELSSLGGTLEDARVLEVGCGAGIDCLLMAMHPVRAAVGIDRELPLFDPAEKGARARRLAKEVLAARGTPLDVEAALRRRPVGFATMDATQMSFPDESFDLLWSRAALEHIAPPGEALAEMARVVRPGGLIYHSIDPFYWLKGCHKGGVADIPWAHARLTPQEYHAFVAQSEGEREAAKRSGHLQTLNQLTPRQWRRILEAGPFEILRWKEESWPFAEALLEEHPEVRDTLLDGVEPGDLTCRQIKVWMRNPGIRSRSGAGFSGT